jgi:RimJ/RimL family protein N-acetyltransferase
MAGAESLVTARLRLRAWTEADREPFAALNADPRVMEFFPSVLTRKQSDATMERIRAHFDRHGFGLWALDVPGVTEFAGFVGLAVPGFEAPFTPCVEIGWRLASSYWGCGYATEGARAALAFGFRSIGLDEIVSLTVPANVRSRRVMVKLGMRYEFADDFDHPLVPEKHPLRRHVLYRLTRQDWESQ